MRDTLCKHCCAALLCSTSRGLHFWEVVPLDVLLEQMGGGAGVTAGPCDSAVAQRLHQLLVPSYFPNPEDGAVSAVRAGLSVCLCTCSSLCRLHSPQVTSHRLQVQHMHVVSSVEPVCDLGDSFTIALFSPCSSWASQIPLQPSMTGDE